MSDIIGKPTVLVNVPSQRVFSKGRAARYLGISEKTLRKITDLGELPSVVLHGRRVYKLEDLDRYINKLEPWTGATEADVRKAAHARREQLRQRSPVVN